MNYSKTTTPHKSKLHTSASVTPTSASTMTTTPRNTGKGLRHFAEKVAQMVEQRVTTTYQEVADDLVREHTAFEDGGNVSLEMASPVSDHKNIRRRAYDALNVLMAMGVIRRSSNKKQVTWQGLPIGPEDGVTGGTAKTQRQMDIAEMERLKREKDKHFVEIRQKREYLQQLLQQRVCYNNLVRHNEEQESKRETGVGSKRELSENAGDEGIEKNDVVEKDEKKQKITKPNENEQIQANLALPFIVINTSNQTMVGCRLCPDRTQAKFTFQKPFEINDDNEILKMLGL